MIGRRGALAGEPQIERDESQGRLRRRAKATETTETDRGRGLFRRLQRRRQGVPEHEGTQEPTPRTESRMGARRQETPRRGVSARTRRIAWSLGSLAATGGGVAWWMRRRGRDREERRRLRRY